MTSTRSLVIQMAGALNDRVTDLGDERACIRTLMACDYRGGDISVLLDAVIETARIRRAAWATTQDVA
jgi:hypothetical protein